MNRLEQLERWSVLKQELEDVDLIVPFLGLEMKSDKGEEGTNGVHREYHEETLVKLRDQATKSTAASSQQQSYTTPYTKYGIPLTPGTTKSERKFLDDTWNLWDYVDFDTCIDRADVDEGKVFKTYTEYKRAVADDAAKLVADDEPQEGLSDNDVHAQAQDSNEPVTPALRGSVVSIIRYYNFLHLFVYPNPSPNFVFSLTPTPFIQNVSSRVISNKYELSNHTAANLIY